MNFQESKFPTCTADLHGFPLKLSIWDKIGLCSYLAALFLCFQGPIKRAVSNLRKLLWKVPPPSKLPQCSYRHKACLMPTASHYGYLTYVLIRMDCRTDWISCAIRRIMTLLPAPGNVAQLVFIIIFSFDKKQQNLKPAWNETESGDNIDILDCSLK